MIKSMVYVASPYNHPDPKKVESNYEKVAKYVAGETARGRVLVSPIVYGHNLLPHEDMPTDWEFWTSFCLSILDRCDSVEVVRMEGWDKSAGVAAEIDFAKQKGLTIQYVDL
jgi:hypothetical protein